MQDLKNRRDHLHLFAQHPGESWSQGSWRGSSERGLRACIAAETAACTRMGFLLKEDSAGNDARVVAKGLHFAGGRVQPPATLRVTEAVHGYSVQNCSGRALQSACAGTLEVTASVNTQVISIL